MDTWDEATKRVGESNGEKVYVEVPSNVDFQLRARQIVWEYANDHLHRSDVEQGAQVDLEQVFVVWFCKTLQNWKVLVSTDLLDGMYYEVTHNGDKNETYVDAYKKFDNRVVPD